MISTQVAAAPAPAEAPAQTTQANSSSSAAAGLPTPLASATPAAPEQTAPAASAKPEGLPAGFNDMAAFVAAYDALKAGQPATPPAPVVPAAPAPAAAPAAPAGGAEASKVDLASLSSEFASSGAISQATYDAYAKAGVSKDIVDAAVAGETAKVQAEINDIYSAVGGQSEFNTLKSWADVNLPVADKQAFNDALGGASVDVVKMVLVGIQAKMTAANGSEPTLLNGQGAGGPVAAFQSIDQVTRAMSDPRYATDPAYRSQIEARLAVSTVL